jgi:lipoprotein-releasing system ATP-binding protein
MSDFLQVRDVHKSFRLGSREIQVLRGVDFSVAEGEMVAITGASGSGKTTLLHIIGTLESADSGTIAYGDVTTTEMRGRSLEEFRNATIGFVFQFFQLLPEFTALENAMMPLLIAGHSAGEAREAAAKVLEEVGLEQRLHHFPSQLSGGEQQRAAIARALVREPKLLLADEPTGNLDAATGERVFDLLRRLQRSRGLTSVIVTHNVEIAGSCDRLLALETLNAGAGGQDA